MSDKSQDVVGPPLFRLVYGEMAYSWPAVRLGDELLTAEGVLDFVKKGNCPHALPGVNLEHVQAWLDSRPRPGDVCVWFVSGVFICCLPNTPAGAPSETE